MKKTFSIIAILFALSTASFAQKEKGEKGEKEGKEKINVPAKLNRSCKKISCSNKSNMGKRKGKL